jgi:hypothetical protein
METKFILIFIQITSTNKMRPFYWPFIGKNETQDSKIPPTLTGRTTRHCRLKNHPIHVHEVFVN